MLQTEKAVLAAVVHENSLVLPLLSNADKYLFDDEYNKITFEEIERLYKEGEPFDFTILLDRLKGKIRAPGTYVASLITALISPELKFLRKHFILHLNALKKNKIKMEIFKEINSYVKNPIFDLDELQNIIRKNNLLDVGIETGNVEECFEEMDQENEEIFLGFPTLDKAIGGFRFGEVLLFMARTGVGKTFWVLNVLLQLLSHTKEKIAFFSLEMPKISVLERLTQITFSLSREQALEKLKTDKETKSCLVNKFKNLMIYTQNYSVEDIELKIKEVGSRIVFIDFLDLLKEQSSESQSRYERISNFIVGLKRVAKEQKSFLIVLHQLSRGAGDGSIPVKFTMARDSGVVEEAADFLLGAWRPEIGYDDIALVPEDMKSRLFIKLLKNKRGNTKIIPCHFDHSKTGKIREIEWNDYF